MVFYCVSVLNGLLIIYTSRWIIINCVVVVGNSAAKNKFVELSKLKIILFRMLRFSALPWWDRLNHSSQRFCSVFCLRTFFELPSIWHQQVVWSYPKPMRLILWPFFSIFQWDRQCNKLEKGKKYVYINNFSMKNINIRNFLQSAMRD